VSTKSVFKPKQIPCIGRSGSKYTKGRKGDSTLDDYRKTIPKGGLLAKSLRGSAGF